MAESFDAYQYLTYLRGRWATPVISCAAAILLVLLFCLVAERKYTATSRIIIEAPAGSDLRAAMAVSPIYLESLKTYELFAASDNVFLQAVEKFGLRNGTTAIDRLKRSVLKITMPLNTKILEISVTLSDPRKAHAVAQYLAEETVKLNRNVNREGDRELIADAEKDLSAERARAEQADRGWRDASVQGPVEQLRAEMESDEELRASLMEQLLVKDAEDPGQARMARQRTQLAGLEKRIAEVQRMLAERSARLEQLDSERKAAQAVLKSAETHLQDVRATVGYRGERLKIIDPGIVPERPSSPDIPLLVGAAALVALVLSMLYLTLEFSFGLQKAESLRASLRIAGRHE
jgi:uncharacterized protein involved in exopolysaccharide biosynthesis